MSVAGLCTAVIAVALAVVAVWWLDRRVLRSGNRWLTAMSCALAAAVAWGLGGMLGVCILPDVAVVEGNAALALYHAEKIVSSALGLLGLPLSVVTFVGAIVQFTRKARTRRWAIVVVPFAACGAFWACAIVFLAAGRG